MLDGWLTEDSMKLHVFELTEEMITQEALRLAHEVMAADGNRAVMKLRQAAREAQGFRAPPQEKADANTLADGRNVA